MQNVPKNCDISFAIGKLHQAYGHMMLPMSMWLVFAYPDIRYPDLSGNFMAAKYPDILKWKSGCFGCLQKLATKYILCSFGVVGFHLFWSFKRTRFPSQDPRQRKSKKKRQLKDSICIRELYQQRWGSLQSTNDLWPYFGHVLIGNITWPHAWWSSPMANEMSQFLGTFCVFCCVIWT